MDAHPIPITAAIHDLSGFGRCSLTVVIPTLSAMGVQVIPMPTALLSTHTGGFTDFTFLDLTQQMKEIAQHWKALSISFDSIYSGFLGSEEQISIVLDFIEQFKASHPLVLVDPVMGDHGQLYATYTPQMQKKMRLLAEQADVITPNITEAFFLLEEPYQEIQTQAMAERLLYRLSQLGPKKIVITGLCFHSQLGNAGLDTSLPQREPFYFMRDRIPKNYPGTGDLFASVLLGKLLTHHSFAVAVSTATDFVHSVVLDTSRFPFPERNGVLLENHLHKLYEKT